MNGISLGYVSQKDYTTMKRDNSGKAFTRLDYYPPKWTFEFGKKKMEIMEIRTFVNVFLRVTTTLEFSGA